MYVAKDKIMNAKHASYTLAFENVAFLTVVEFHKIKFITGFLLPREQITSGR